MARQDSEKRHSFCASLPSCISKSDVQQLALAHLVRSATPDVATRWMMAALMGSVTLSIPVWIDI